LNFWDYLYAGCIVVIGLLLMATTLLGFAATRQERAARKTPENLTEEARNKGKDKSRV